MANKTCKSCKQTKELSDFYLLSKVTKNTDELGYDYYCKYCRNGSHLRSVKNNKVRCSLPDCDRPHYAKTLCRMHGERLKRTGSTEAKIKPVSNVKEDNPKAYINRKSQLKQRFNMEIDDFVARSADGCEICGDKPERNLQVDHDHNCCDSTKTCGKCVRGIVCHTCNTAIDKMENGLMREDYPNYVLIQQYLELYNG